MPAYFFDFVSDKEVLIDKIGTELNNEISAQQEATATLLDLMRGTETASHRSVAIIVKNAAGHPIYRADLIFSGVRLVQSTGEGERSGELVPP